jgi:hypothetical protein
MPSLYGFQISLSGVTRISLPVSEVEYNLKLDEAGTWKVTLPATDPRTSLLEGGNYWIQYQEGSGILFVGIIENIRRLSSRTLEISGTTVLGELAKYNTYIGKRYVNDLGNDIVDALLSEVGWQREGNLPGAYTVYFEGVSYLEALRKLVSDLGTYHFREKIIHSPGASPEFTKIVEIGQFGDVKARIRPYVQPGFTGEFLQPALATSITVVQDSRELWYRFLPLGTGFGNVLLDLRYQTRLPNLLTNGGFENVSTGWTASGTATTNFSSTRALDGKYSLRTQATSTYSLYQNISITANKEYRAEVWAYIAAGTATLRVEFRNSSNTIVTTHTDSKTPSTEWQKLSVRATAPTGAVTARVILQISGASSDIYWDSARFWESALSAGKPLELETELSRTDTLTPHLNYILEVASLYNNPSRPPILPTKIIKFKDVFPSSPDLSAIENACNTLYDLTVTEMLRSSIQSTTYELGEVVGLPTDIRPGDKVHVFWRGIVDTWDGKYQYIDVDQDLWITEIQRSLTSNGQDRWNLTVSTNVNAPEANDSTVIREITVIIKTTTVAPQATTANWTVTHALRTPLGPGAGEELTFKIKVPENIVELFRCKLLISPQKIRATARGAAAGGGQTSSTADNHYHTVIIPPHSHGISATVTETGGTVSTTTSATAPIHRHSLGATSTTTTTPPSTYQWVLFTTDTGGLYAALVGVSSPASVVLATNAMDASQTHTHDVHIPGHSHNISAQSTSSGGGMFLTSESSGAHSHYISPHTHELVYGIFDGTQAQNLRIYIDGVDRTTLLGGPWNSEVELDITPFLLGIAGNPLHGYHTIKITTTQLGAVDVISEWVAAVIPVGVV